MQEWGYPRCCCCLGWWLFFRHFLSHRHQRTRFCLESKFRGLPSSRKFFWRLWNNTSPSLERDLLVGESLNKKKWNNDCEKEARMLWGGICFFGSGTETTTIILRGIQKANTPGTQQVNTPSTTIRLPTTLRQRSNKLCPPVPSTPLAITAVQQRVVPKYPGKSASQTVALRIQSSIQNKFLCDHRQPQIMRWNWTTKRILWCLSKQQQTSNNFFAHGPWQRNNDLPMPTVALTKTHAKLDYKYRTISLWLCH